MKKKIIIIFSIILIALSIVKIYQTFATSSAVAPSSDNIYNVTLTDNSVVSIPAKSSKIVFYQICNTNNGKVQYGVGYTGNNSEVIAKVYWDSIDPVNGVIDYGENKFIKLKLINNSTSASTITLSTVLGYEKGGELKPSTDVTLISDIINENNVLKSAGSVTDATSNFLSDTLGITREKIATVTFEKDNIVPDGLVGDDVSASGDGSIMMWYKRNETDNTLYDVYIGSDNGKVSVNDGNSLFKNLTSAISITINNIITSQATSMASMFENCQELTNLDLSNFDTSKVTNMNGMFSECDVITKLDLSTFVTPLLTNISNMFYSCDNLTSININNMNFDNVTNFTDAFSLNDNLSSIKGNDSLKTWFTNNIPDLVDIVRS